MTTKIKFKKLETRYEVLEDKLYNGDKFYKTPYKEHVEVLKGISAIRKKIKPKRSEDSLQKHLVKVLNGSRIRRTDFYALCYNFLNYGCLESNKKDVRRYTKFCLESTLREKEHETKEEKFKCNNGHLLKCLSKKRKYSSWDRTLISDLRYYGYILNGNSFCSNPGRMFSCYCSATLKFLIFAANFIECLEPTGLEPNPEFSTIDINFMADYSFEDCARIITQKYLQVFKEECAQEVDVDGAVVKDVDTMLKEINICVSNKVIELPLDLKGFKILTKEEKNKLAPTYKKVYIERLTKFRNFVRALEKDAEIFNKKHNVIQKKYKVTETGIIKMTISGRSSPTKNSCALTKKEEKTVFEQLQLLYNYDLNAEIYFNSYILKYGKLPKFKMKYFKGECDHIVKKFIEIVLDKEDRNGKTYLENCQELWFKDRKSEWNRNEQTEKEFFNWIYQKIKKVGAIQYRAFFEDSKKNMLKNLNKNFRHAKTETWKENGKNYKQKVIYIEDNAITRMCSELCCLMYDWVQKNYNTKNNASIFVIGSAVANYVYTMLRRDGIKVINKYDCYVTDKECKFKILYYIEKFLSLFKLTKNFLVKPKIRSRQALIQTLVNA